MQAKVLGQMRTEGKAQTYKCGQILHRMATAEAAKCCVWPTVLVGTSAPL